MKRLGNQTFPAHHRGLSGKSNPLPKLYLCEDMFFRLPPLRTQGQTLPLPQPSLFRPHLQRPTLVLTHLQFQLNALDLPNSAVSGQLQGNTG